MWQSVPATFLGRKVPPRLSLHFAEGDQPSDDLIQETFGIAREAADTLLS